MNDATAVSAFLALGNPVRLAIFRRMLQAGQRGMSVREVAAELGLLASATTLHVRGLEQAGLLQVSPESRTVALQRRVRGDIRCVASRTRLLELLGLLVEDCDPGMRPLVEASVSRLQACVEEPASCEPVVAQAAAR